MFQLNELPKKYYSNFEFLCNFITIYKKSLFTLNLNSDNSIILQYYNFITSATIILSYKFFSTKLNSFTYKKYSLVFHNGSIISKISDNIYMNTIKPCRYNNCRFSCYFFEKLEPVWNNVYINLSQKIISNI